MGKPLLERCVANGKCAIAVGGVRPELGTCSALSVGRVSCSLTLGWARGGVYISGLQAAPTTWHMRAPQDMVCISDSIDDQRQRLLYFAQYRYACIHMCRGASQKHSTFVAA